VTWTTGEILSLAMVVLVVTGGIWGVIKGLLARDRKSVDDQAKAMWKRLDELRAELVKTQIEQGVIKEQVRQLPDKDALHEKFQDLQEKLDQKLERISEQVQEAFSVAASKFRCPHAVDVEDPAKHITLTGSGAKILAPLLEAAQREGGSRRL